MQFQGSFDVENSHLLPEVLGSFLTFFAPEICSLGKHILTINTKLGCFSVTNLHPLFF